MALAVAGAALMMAGCSRSLQPPVPQPEPPPAAPPTSRALAPAAVAGTWRMSYQLEQAPGQRRGQRTQRAQNMSSELRLDNQPVAVLEPEVASTVQFGAAIRLPGYTRPPRGRNTQSAVWYPAPGDSIVVQFTSAQGAQIQLRGTLQAGLLRGDIWYISSASGASFQLGTFTASRAGGPRGRQ